MHEEIKKAIAAIKHALGQDSELFDVKHSETLDVEKGRHDALYSIEPKTGLELEDTRIEADVVYLQIVIKAGEDPYLIAGEDDESSLTRAVIYSQLYWGQTCKCASA